MPAMASPKLTVLGWDAATFDIIDPLIEAGQLPNLRRIFEAGSRGVLRSTMPPITSQAWATAFTGVNAARHGLWEFSERDESGYRLRLVNGSFRRARAVWDYLTDAGVSVGVVVVVVGVVSGFDSDAVGSGAGSSIRAPVAVTLRPLRADETIGMTGSGSGTSLLIGSNPPSKRTRKLPSLSFGVRASTRSIRDSRVFR